MERPDIVALISTLRFLDPVLAMAPTATRFLDTMDDIRASFTRLGVSGGYTAGFIVSDA